MATENTYLDVLLQRFEELADNVAYRFLQTGDVDGPVDVLTYRELGLRTRAIAGWLQEHGLEGERALLVYPPGLDFIEGFLGCVSAGVVAVPVPLPHATDFDRAMRRLAQVIEDADVSVVLTTNAVEDILQSAGGALGDIELRARTVATDTIPNSYSSQHRIPQLSAESIAFLQYTSGSTSAPKGVVVTHGNLLHNQSAISLAMGHTANGSDTVAVSWLPMYHDMGLIGPVLGTLYSGGTAILFSPLHFIQRPERWVKAISHFKATNSGGPNFAYEITARRVTQDVVESLDLSHWRLAFCGAEPVRASTVRRFADTFAPARFHRTAFQPVYGLAEATLIVCAVPLGQEPTLLALAPPDGGGAGKEVVGVGVPVSGTTVVIVDPETSRECPVGAEGEIWVASGSVSPGYLNGVAANQDVFQATLADGRSGYLRTGDLGFAADGQLFVTGRLKDVLIVDGRNLHPQDLELTAESAHDNVRPGGVAAFAVDDDETEGIVVLAEVRAEDDETLESTAAAVRRKISAEHGVRLRAVVLISARSIFKTSSGKIQRQACRGAYLDGALPNVVAVDGNPVPTAKSVDVDRQVQEQTIVAAPGADASDMQSLLQRVVAEACGIAAEDVMADRPLVELGLGSRQLVELIGVVSDQLGRPLDPSLIFEHPTVRSLADALEGESREAVAPTTGPTDDQPIAVLSMACRFPGGANTPEKLWQILHDGRDVISDVPADRWDVDGMSDAGFQGGFLPDVKSFDASFFGISPREAEAMDPHQRLLMQLSWEAMERAGIVPKHLEGTKTGVFIGMYGGQYLAGIDLRQLDGYVATGTATSVASGRISYTFGLRGPAITVDTACSSALVSLHLAAQSLRRGECDAALVGSATLLLTPSAHVEFSQLGVLSPTGRCAPFAADADGAVWSEGGGMVILKRLDDAVRDGDPVLAVIRGSAVNQDGRSQGLSAPNGLAQDEVISAALHDAGLAAQDVDYIEAHGTATAVGDRIEARSLARVFSDASRGNPLRIGAIKSNIGHTQASAGIAGLIKTILALQHNVLPISLYAGEPSADWNQTGLELVATAEPWDRRPDRVRTAGVSSFGISGTNAHVVLQEPPAAAIPMAMTNQRVSQHLPFLLSARSQHSLRSMSAKLRDFVAADPDLALADIATTLAVYRTHFEDRAVIVAQDRDELLAGLDSLASSTAADHVSIASEVKTHTGKVAFVFPGQGSQWLGMARDIYQMSETFRREFDRCDLAFYEHLGWSVTNRLIRMDDADDLARDEVVQPLLFSVMVSLAAVWQRQGIHPDAVVGHSQGEIAAAYISGVLQLSDAAGIVARRSSVLSLTPSNGRMLLIAAPIEDVVTAVNNLDNDDVSIAAVNSARAVVLSGAAEALETLAAQFEHGGAFTRLLPVRYASHSHYMDPIEDVLNHDLAHIQPQDVDSTITWYSTVTGDPIRGTTATAGYWFRNIRETVQFGITVERMIADGYRYFLEISPHPLLTTDLESIGDGATITPSVFHSLRRDVDGPRCMVASLAGMHLAGIPVDWNHALPAAKRIDLPTYAFEGKRFWLEARGGSSSVRGHGLGAADHPLVSVV
ncbi:beta-ketoacyl synthase N-terminal-like domain-containing protein, partial [Nocardia ninae]|uniref:beta-ketoacyl synthase N-terminal-like domain-containing protein n=2 Tax=Nocardia ninae TaxID=356145 RepID=UPI0039F105E5